MDLQDVLDVLAALEREGVRYAVFGGLAMAAHGLDRGTRDLDLFLAADEENVARLRRALHDVYEDPAIEEITSADLDGEYPAIQYGPPGVTFTIDIVSRLGDAFTFADLDVQHVRVGELEVAVVTPRTLYAMKRNTVRPRDADDAARLRRAFDLEDD
ncbi:hypothetical protein BH20ACT7_BH20ACT7_07130 [soil metagenome]